MAKSKDDSMSNFFHQTVELHLDYGSEILRRILMAKLQSKNISLKTHLKKSKSGLYNSYKKGYLHHDQWNLLFPGQNKDPDLSDLDITLLTHLFLGTKVPLTNNETNEIKDLRRKRNEISHVPKAELKDKTNFNTTRQLLLDLAKGILGQKSADKLKENIDTILTRKEFVSCRRNLEIVKIRNEELMVKLVDRPGDETDDPTDMTYLRFSLTKWIRQFAREIDLGTLLTCLKHKGTISNEDKAEVEELYNKEEQSCKLIMKVLDETDDKLGEFCLCLRQVNRNLADLIENRNTDGAEIESRLRRSEKEKIREIIKTHFKTDETGSVQCEEVHIVVEDKFGDQLDYSLVEEVFLEEFKSERFKPGNDRFDGIVSHNIDDIKKIRTSCYKNVPGESFEETGEGPSNMSCDLLAEYASSCLEQIKPNGPIYGPKIKDAICRECITPKIFISMTREDFKNCFGDYIEEKIPFGILKEMEEIQQLLRKKRTRYNSGHVDNMRTFDATTGLTKYKMEHIRPARGNLMVPAHEFRTLPKNGEYTTPYIVKESVKFIAACLNSRKNGTIHFGIKATGNGSGFVVGIERVSEDVRTSIDAEITRGIETCFLPDKISAVKRCVRPLQVVPVENGSVVLETDVIPFNGYLNSDFFPVQFPPKGRKDTHLFVYNNDTECEILTIPVNRHSEVIKLYKANIKERSLLEVKRKRMPDDSNSLARKLVTALTAGNEYVTDQFTPMICVGKMTGCDRQDTVNDLFDIPEAFLSSVAVLDFNSSTRLRKSIEKQDTVFRVITAKEKKPDETLFAGSDRIWMYCNGNTDLLIDELDFKDWFRDRFSIVKEAMRLCKQKTPEQRAMVIFFVFDNLGFKDPILEVAEECIKCEYRNQCLVISESDEAVKDLKKKLAEVLPSDEINTYFYTGMKWNEITQTVRTVFRTCTQYDDKLPCSNRHFVLLTSEEKRQMNFTDIEILSGEQCKREEMADEEDEKRRKRKLKEQENFYKGRDVSWWNFHYADQVGKRDLHANYVEAARNKLGTEGGKLIEIEKIRHQPGAGGTTAGRYVLWHLSQFDQQGSAKAYRCCVVKQVTENTAKEIYSFLSFKDNSPKPVVILADNISDDNIHELKSQLDEQAYKNGEANKLFCLLIIVQRVPVSYKAKPGEKILKHELSKAEQSWFESKYKELENTHEIDVKTLISFNVMRKSFDPKYIQELADEILGGVTETEKDVLKCLSLVNTYDRENMIPISTFDCLMLPAGQLPGQFSIWQLKNKGPVGLVVPMMGNRHDPSTRNIWNVDITDELALLIKKSSDGVIQSGVTIISQALANAILSYIMKEEDLTLEDVVKFVLEIVKSHVGQRNPMSKHFVKIVNGLFKTRQMLTEKGDIKNKFSDMIMELKQPRKNEERSVATDRVVNVMNQCFDITSDAMVGQQLARFFIHMKEFEKAENIILKSLKQLPNSSYLLDTHGQIYKTKMETLIQEKGADISDADAAQIIKSAFTAIEKFVQGEDCTIHSMEAEMNLSCFYMEVKTTLLLLEKFEKFSCYGNRKNLLNFLNESDFEVETSSFKDIAKQCPLKELRKGSKTQEHISESLRMLEERDYQVKQKFYIVSSPSNEKLLLKLRERFESFYGSDEETSKFQFTYGLGLKSLMQADASTKGRVQLQNRVREAKDRLELCERSSSKVVDKRDLLVLLGFEIIQVSKSKAKRTQVTLEEYQQLLRYSEKLLELERTAKRPYIEAYLYYAILHCPSSSRLELEDLRRGHLCKPARFANMLHEWKKAFESNFEIKSYAEHKKNVPKTYFVLGKGDPGCDIVDLECIRKKWKELKRRTENRTKPPVKADNFWKEGFVVKRLQRFTGILDDSGKTIHYKAEYDLWKYELSIRTYYPHPYLSNRRVTFVLGFTWSDLAAFDVEEEGDDVTNRTASTHDHSSVSDLTDDYESSETGDLSIDWDEGAIWTDEGTSIDEHGEGLDDSFNVADEDNMSSNSDQLYTWTNFDDYDDGADDDIPTGATGGVRSQREATTTSRTVEYDVQAAHTVTPGLKQTFVRGQNRNKDQDKEHDGQFTHEKLVKIVRTGEAVPVKPSEDMHKDLASSPGKFLEFRRQTYQEVVTKESMDLYPKPAKKKAQSRKRDEAASTSRAVEYDVQTAHTVTPPLKQTNKQTNVRGQNRNKDEDKEHDGLSAYEKLVKMVKIGEAVPVKPSEDMHEDLASSPEKFSEFFRQTYQDYSEVETKESIGLHPKPAKKKKQSRKRDVDVDELD